MAEANGDKSAVWKWIAGIVTAAALSGVGSALAFRTSPATIKRVMTETFTDVSDSRGMYAKEGRPKIEALETKVEAIMLMLRESREWQVRMETKLDKR